MKWSYVNVFLQRNLARVESNLSTDRNRDRLIKTFQMNIVGSRPVSRAQLSDSAVSGERS